MSVLDAPGVMYIWDQLFMQNWTQSAIINVCLSLMELLRHRFMEAYDYITMKEVSNVDLVLKYRYSNFFFKVILVSTAVLH